MECTVLLFAVAHLYSAEGDFQPDILLKGKYLRSNTLTVIQLICSTNIAVWQCSVEFLKDNITHYDIRYADNTCYNTHGICSPNICACSKSCKSFTWNVTVINDVKNHSYSCATRIDTGEVLFTANITVKWNDNDGFQTLQKIIVPFDIVTQHPTTPNSDAAQSINVPTAVAVLSCICTLILLIVLCWKNCGLIQHKASPESTIENPNQVNVEASHGNTIETPSQVNVEASQGSSIETPSQVNVEEDSMNANITAPEDRRKKCTYEHDPYRRHSSAPLIRKSNPLHVYTQENRHTLDAFQRLSRSDPALVKKVKDDVRLRDFPARTNNLKISTSTPSVSVRYSALSGHESSTNADSNAKGEGEGIQYEVNYQMIDNITDESNA